MSIQNNYYGYVYKITCLINKRCYVGQKRKPIFDNTYWGSSKNKDYWNDLKQYGYKNFERKVLYWAITQQELNQKETEYIISEKALFTEGGYNLWLNRQQTELTNEIVEKHHRNLLKAMSLPEYKEKMKKVAESRKGKTRSKEICKKLSESLKNSAKHKAVMSSVEYKQKMSNIIKNSEKHQRWYMDEDLKKLRYNTETNLKISRSISKNNTDRHWYTNELKNVFCKECPEGFHPGRSKAVRNKIAQAKKKNKINVSENNKNN